MLRIKDDVYLKELQKFGFIEYSIAGKTKYKFKRIIGKQEIYNIKIDGTRILHYNQCSVYNELPDVLYDLIQAGLVEKIKE